MDLPLIIHITGEWTVAGWCKRDLTSSSLRLIIRGTRQRQHGSRLHKPACGPELLTSVYEQKEKVKKQSQGKKEIRR